MASFKDLYTDIKARVLFAGSLSREFNISQGTGHGRLLAPFMYKVYINGLLKTLSEHCFAISINSLSLSSPSFADDVTLLALFPSFLQTLMNLCHNYSLRWRYQFNHIKSGVVTFGECKPTHSKLMKERKWLLGHMAVYELCEYKNLGVLKNYANSFSTNVEDNIEKARKKAGMIFACNFDRCKTKLLIYIKFWREACLLSLLFGAELFSLTTTQLNQLESCQHWFLKKIFYVPQFAPAKFLLKVSGLNSIESEIDVKKLLFLGRLITEMKMTSAVRSLFFNRVDSFLKLNIQLLEFYTAFARLSTNMICFIILNGGIPRVFFTRTITGNC